MTAVPTPKESVAEERANVLTHAAAAVVSGVVFVELIRQSLAAHDPLRIASSIVYAVGMIGLFAISTCYHVCRADSRHKRRWRSIDHAAIYLLIAATYTPLLIVTLRGPAGWGLFAFLWIAAAVGVWLKLASVERSPFWSTGTYLAMGWAGLAVIRPMLAALPPGGFAWILAGGLLYTLGVIFFAWERLPFNHAIWHVFVAAASACHFVAIARYILA